MNAVGTAHALRGFRLRAAQFSRETMRPECRFVVVKHQADGLFALKSPLFMTESQ